MSLAPTTPHTVLTCGKCRLWLAGQFLGTRDFVHCPGCGTAVKLEVYPALFRPPGAVATGEILMMDGEAACFYHPAKRAVVPCAACGRFLCSLCDIEMAGDHLCAPCMQAGAKKGKIRNLQNERILYDDIAASLGVGGFLLCLYPSIITAPIAIYVTIKHWNSPGSIIPRGKWRFVLGVGASVVSLLVLAAAAYSIMVA